MYKTSLYKSCYILKSIFLELHRFKELSQAFITIPLIIKMEYLRIIYLLFIDDLRFTFNAFLYLDAFFIYSRTALLKSIILFFTLIEIGTVE